MTELKAMIFDIDGVLVDNSHRLPYLKQDPKDYDRFFSDEEIMKDAPIEFMLLITRTIYAAVSKYRIFLCTGRPERTRNVTVRQLLMHRGCYSDLLMPADGDHRPAHLVKLDMLKQICNGYGFFVEAAFEDEPKTVEMYRTYGVRCLAMDPKGWT